MSQSFAAALSDRDSNVQMTSGGSNQVAPGEENKLHGEQHKQVSGLNRKGNGTYVSPSDAILSPASQKLAGFKQRQINKQTNNKNPTARSLFSRTASSVSSGSLEDSKDAQ
ncbi:uncharacterized protein MYCFIDRAFT_77611 [Pseudocercospora fijiensis CIRAD86]|uniref:Uncharacterized protein n=1 Tax=Pseudocercospora fijiensis (strain CIRAD86) TaxID=383855 RepID=M3AY57_PSEFD|nr:uncharacterized protein MYCFIDRAFT_77611 [Pseudocercospora fijiensis CIRAD86]EME82093.1 hypothetical protein MYCFIDRAFT_77611 [Pseudocercospora fijiensis CIRAD86]